MSTDRETTRVVRSWLEEGVTRLPDRVLDVVLDHLPATPQRRSRWSAWRSLQMSNYAKLAAAAAAVLVVAVVGYNLLPGSGGSNAGGPTAAPSVEASPPPVPTGTPTATGQAFTVRPFAQADGLGMCPEDAGAACVEDPRDDTISFTYVLPGAWSRHENFGAYVEDEDSNRGVSVLFNRGNWLLSDPCRPPDDQAGGDLPVGPTVEDFVTALVNHPDIDVTDPVDVTLAGYSGKYVEITTPADIGECDTWRPIDEHIYAQGPAHRWHMWVIDVVGVRVLVEMTDFADSLAAHRQEALSMVDSLVITP
jgi:hypothetical protein